MSFPFLVRLLPITMAEMANARPGTAEGELKTSENVHDRELQSEPLQEYDIARIEKVYKRLDLRIIPGEPLLSP